ncbi:MAG TPA: preprotein translocase subunit YajC [Candidatus Corynebacterium avicola]|uniref:Preprotein translocase subunit YajC n=1 Tax=Candidatus Corynebacterium avicola TaxID=2838527 RepID=A0A9D1UL47_9CORY|nr:preprotein translocase subunit YajC [Candidatus Corynebacterium avicola]
MEIILLVLLAVVFLGLPILSMRKQSKQINEIKSFQSQLEPGMIVQMTSGLHGRIDEVGPTTVSLELTPGVITTWDRNAVLKRVDSDDATEAASAAGDAGNVENAGDNSGYSSYSDYSRPADEDDNPQVPDSPEGIEDFDTRRDSNDTDGDGNESNGDNSGRS